MGKSKIVISRSNTIFGSAVKYKIELDGITVGQLSRGKTITIDVNEGMHTLRFIVHGQCQKDINVNITETTGDININTKINFSSGKIELETANLDSITFNSELSSEKYSDKRKIPTSVSLALAVVIIVFTFSIIIAMSNSDSEFESKYTDEIYIENELTGDEKAKAYLKMASEKFAEDNYMKAITVCNKIVSDHPESEEAKNMEQYLSEQYLKYENISATSLMDEYEANIVNADKVYNDKVLIVDGVVGSIDKTNNGNNLCVLLKTNVLFSAVQLNFDTNQEDAVAQLKEGDTIKVIGKCTGKSGKLFVILDANNVMIEDCYIIQ